MYKPTKKGTPGPEQTRLHITQHPLDCHKMTKQSVPGTQTRTESTSATKQSVQGTRTHNPLLSQSGKKKYSSCKEFYDLLMNTNKYS